MRMATSSTRTRRAPASWRRSASRSVSCCLRAIVARFEAVAPSPRLRRDRGGEPDLRHLAGAHRRPRLHQPLRHGRDRRAGHRQVPRPEPQPGVPVPLGRHARLRQPGERRSRGRLGAGRRHRPPVGPPARRCWSTSGPTRARPLEVESGWPHLRAAAGGRPGVRLHQRLRHRRHGGEGAGAAGPRERAAPAEHPARADRPAAARRANRSSPTASTT